METVYGEKNGADDLCNKDDLRIPTIDGDLSDSCRNMNKSSTKKPKRILHFSDGVIEEYSSEDEKVCQFNYSSKLFCYRSILILFDNSQKYKNVKNNLYFTKNHSTLVCLSESLLIDLMF